MRIDLLGGPADGHRTSVPMPLPERVYVPWQLPGTAWDDCCVVLTYLRLPSGRYVHESLRRSAMQ